uniref:Pseudouridine synthase RsuA/RluA-like domain-containing protein n=1 Tax=Strigamia maritima TaxID=126957 RepID=T1JGR8_STRMM
MHKSDDYLIVDKDYDLVLNGENWSRSVEKQLRRRFPTLVNPKLTFGFHFPHRLDYSTSGVLCVALNKRAAASAVDAFTRRASRKYYLALVRGHLSRERLAIDAGVGKDGRRDHTHRMCTWDKRHCDRGRTASTKLLVLQRGVYDGYPATKLLVKPITGRRHQIRVHCAEIGHTIVGDYTYSNREDSSSYRMFLHAYRLVVPTDLERIDVRTGDPFDGVRHRDDKWIAVETLNELDESVFDEIDETWTDEIVKKKSNSL